MLGAAAAVKLKVKGIYKHTGHPHKEKNQLKLLQGFFFHQSISDIFINSDTEFCPLCGETLPALPAWKVYIGKKCVLSAMNNGVFSFAGGGDINQ